MSPDARAMLLSFPIIAIAAAAAVPHLGGMRIQEIDSEGLPSSVKRLILPLKGHSYLSGERVRSEEEVGSLGYVGKASSSYDDGTFSISVEYKDGGTLMLSGRDAFILYPDGIVPVDPRDIPVLMEVYPAIEEDGPGGFLEGGAEDDAVRSSILYPIDDNVSDKGAVTASGLERCGVGF